MIYIVANTERQARSLASKNKFARWRYAMKPSDISGVGPGSYVFIQNEWVETPLQKTNDDGDPFYVYPMAERLTQLGEYLVTGGAVAAFHSRTWSRCRSRRSGS